MRNRSNLLARMAFFLLLSFPALAFSPIGRVSCAEPFTMDGHAVAVSGVTTIPLVVGDEVATETAPAVLFFADGSSVRLAAGSRAKLTGSETQPKLVLLAGSLDYKVVLGSSLSVTSLDVERKGRVIRTSSPPLGK